VKVIRTELTVAGAKRGGTAVARMTYEFDASAWPSGTRRVYSTYRRWVDAHVALALAAGKSGDLDAVLEDLVGRDIDAYLGRVTADLPDETMGEVPLDPIVARLFDRALAWERGRS
jgi:hypothetical protein